MASPNLDLIKTIVVVMMENRSFDHMLGYLSLREGWEPVEGVRPNDPAWVARTTNSFQQKAYPPFEQLDVIHKMAGDPPHEWTDIARQMGNPDADGNFPMNGFVANYATAQEKPDVIDESHPPVMGYFSGERVPVTDLLATNFAVCDHWFSSLPAGTQANRLMSMAGTFFLPFGLPSNPNFPCIASWLIRKRWRIPPLNASRPTN